ncbi:MAG: WYL domain-containing protein [Thermoplasmata archaeon]
MDKEFTQEELAYLYTILRMMEEGFLSDRSSEDDYYEEEYWDDEEEEWEDEEEPERTSIIKKLKKLLPEKEIKQIEKYILRIKYGGFYRGVNERTFAKLEEAFEKKRTVKVEYYSTTEDNITEREIDIYYLSRKYIIGYCHLRKEIRKFRADRFIRVEITRKKYEVPDGFDKKEWL